MSLVRKLSGCIIGLAALSGCNQLQDCINEELTNLSICHRAKCAWCECRYNYMDCQDYLWDFGCGFRYGYAAVLGGGDGCPPTLPPRKYWGPCYQTPEGHAAIVAWFDGYQHGAAMAMADGGSSGSIPTSDEIYRKGCRGPVDIDFEAFKKSHPAPTSHSPALMDGDVPPLPDGDVGAPIVPPNTEPYSPKVLPKPTEEIGPSAELPGDETALR
jgi:hypothetical protein